MQNIDTSRRTESRLVLQPLNLSSSTTNLTKTKSKKRELDQIDTMISFRKMNASQVLRRTEVNNVQRKIAEEDERKPDQNADTAAYLHQLKKSHDELVKQSSFKQAETNRLKEEIEAIKKKLQYSSATALSQRQNREQMDAQLEILRNKQETSALASKTFEHILDRMKKDEIIYQLKINELEKQMKEMQTQLHSSISRIRSLHEFQALSAIAADSVKKVCEEANRKRHYEMEQYETLLNQKKEADRRHEQRQRVTDEIQAMAASDLNDANLIKWKKLLLVQKFMKKLLKSKMNCLESKFKDVKEVYHLIKLKTTVNDPSVLASNFFALEDTYLSHLGTIKRLEEAAASLQQKKKVLEEQYKQVRSQLFLIGDESHDQTDDFQQLLREARELVEKTSHSELTEDKVFFWVEHHLQKLQMITHKNTTDKKKSAEELSKSLVVEAFSRFCSQILTTAKNLCEDPERKKCNFVALRKLEAGTQRNMGDVRSEQDESTALEESAV